MTIPAPALLLAFFLITGAAVCVESRCNDLHHGRHARDTAKKRGVIKEAEVLHE